MGRLQTKKQLTRNLRKMLKTSFEVAIAQLTDRELQTRLGAIYQLEEIANCQKYYCQVLDTLANFVRNHARSQQKFNNSQLPNIRIDIQAAVSIIARNAKQGRENQILDLSYVDIKGVNLDDANLERAILYQTNLAGASLNRANLHKAVLSAANLAGANLSQANLSQAIMGAANLTGANLSYANLYQTNLFLANLHGAILDGTNLCSTNLRDANLSNTKLKSPMIENDRC